MSRSNQPSRLKKCPDCNARISRDADFCPRCGRPSYKDYVREEGDDDEPVRLRRKPGCLGSLVSLAYAFLKVILVIALIVVALVLCAVFLLPKRAP